MSPRLKRRTRALKILMQLGFVSAIVPDLSLDEVFALAGSIGYDCVELMCWPAGKVERRYAGITHIDVIGMDQRAIDGIQELSAASGVAISSLGYYPNPLTPDAEESTIACSHLKKVILAAKALNLSVVGSFVGRDWTRSVDDNWPRFKAVWPDLIKFAEDHGIKIAIENCPMLFTRDEWPGGKNLGHSPALWRRMFETIPSQNFGLNYDPSHLVWQMMDYIRPLHDFSDRIFRIHLKDARVDRERLNQVGILAHPLEYHSPKLPGLGEIEWAHFFAAVGDIGYDGPVCVEVEDRAYEADLDARKRALIQSHDYVRPFVSRGAAHADKPGSKLLS
jgi:sugar phosphate isomerase/epimerase